MYFEHAQQDRTIDAKPPATHESVDKAHGRLETRRTYCSDDLAWMSVRKRWKGLRTIVMVERERIVGGKASTEKAYYLSTLAPDAERLGGLVRRHWSIENELHWVLDMRFRRGPLAHSRPKRSDESGAAAQAGACPFQTRAVRPAQEHCHETPTRRLGQRLLVPSARCSAVESLDGPMRGRQ